MSVGNAGDSSNAALQLPCHVEIVNPVLADGPHIDLSRQPEIQDLRDDVCRLKIERHVGKSGRQHLAQLAYVLGGRRMPLFQRHHDHTVIGADGRAVGKGQIVGTGGQTDIVDDQLAVVIGDHLADLVFDCLEEFLGRLDARSGRSADMQLDLSAIDQRIEIAADCEIHHAAQ